MSNTGVHVRRSASGQGDGPGGGHAIWMHFALRVRKSARRQGGGNGGGHTRWIRPEVHVQRSAHGQTKERRIAARIGRDAKGFKLTLFYFFLFFLMIRRCICVIYITREVQATIRKRANLT